MDNRIFIINKPKGFTSQDVVGKFKKIMQVKKAGHTGTLDPLATGVLPILSGNTTKLSKYLIEHDKTYIATLQLGAKSSTGDLEVDIVEQKEVNMNQDFISIIKCFEGKIEQTPPMYSAIKVNGKKLYEYARENKQIDIPKRIVTIYQIEILKVDEPEKRIVFKVSCSSGTYIRTLCEDISFKLGTVGLMSNLQRIKVNDFSIDEAITFEELENNKNDLNWLKSHSYTMKQVMSYLPRIDLNINRLDYFINGGKIQVDSIQKNIEINGGSYNIYSDDKYIGIGIVKDRYLKRDIIEE